MLLLNRKTWIFLSGLLWLLVGTGLLSMGLHLLSDAIEVSDATLAEGYPLLSTLALGMGGTSPAAFLLVCTALVLGYMKGRYVLRKSVHRVVARIISVQEPMAPSEAYSRGYVILIVGMMFLGMGIKFFGVPNDVRGFIDTAVGAGLIMGAFLYFRTASNYEPYPSHL